MHELTTAEVAQVAAGSSDCTPPFSREIEAPRVYEIPLLPGVDPFAAANAQ